MIESYSFVRCRRNHCASKTAVKFSKAVELFASEFDCEFPNLLLNLPIISELFMQPSQLTFRQLQDMLQISCEFRNIPDAGSPSNGGGDQIERHLEGSR